MLKREQLPTETTALQNLVLTLDQQRELLVYQLENFKKRYFGSSSEKRHDPKGQGQFFEDLPAAPTSAQALQQAEVIPKGEKKPRAHGRRKLPPELKRERREYQPKAIEQSCPCGCGKPWQRIGEEISEQLERIPEQYFAIQHVRVKYISGCGKHIVIGQVPDKLWDRAMPGPGLIADLIVKKCALHEPLYRNEWHTQQLGFEIARSTQCQWLGAAAELLEPLYLQAKLEALRSYLIHTDDTPVRVQAPGNGKTREGRFWVYVGDPLHPVTIFDYTPNRKREGPKNFLGQFAGVLQADAYGGYDGIYTNGRVREAGCMAHARRKYNDAKSSAPNEAREMLDLIGKLYAVEDQARPTIERAVLAPEERRAAALAAAYRQRLDLRRALSAPVMDQIKAWLAPHKVDVIPESNLGKAIEYMENQWSALSYFLQDGAADIDNNPAENAVRPLAVGRKNWLFLGNDEGGHRLAILYSLVESCRRNKINPWDYLKDVLVCLSTQPPDNLADLLPHRWKQAHEKIATTAPSASAATPAAASP